jgi:hypothetical protein
VLDNSFDYQYYNLIDFYNRVLLPLPQRKYGKNRQSIVLQQNECNKRSVKRKFEESKSEEIDKIIFNNNNEIEKFQNQKTIQLKSEFETKRQKILWP